MRLIKDWVNNEHIIISDDDLAEMRKFIDSVNNFNSLDELVLEVVQGIHEKVRAYILFARPLSHLVSKACLNFPPPPITPVLDSEIRAGPTPSQLAMALAKMEKETYERILPIEYMAHVGRVPSCCPNLSAAIDLNQRINYWVQSSILDMDFDGAPDELDRRCEVKRFFVKTAQVVYPFEW